MSSSSALVFTMASLHVLLWTLAGLVLCTWYVVFISRTTFALTAYQTGAGTSASRLGVADLGIAHLADMKANAEMIANLDPNGPPLIADMDHGYGGPIMVANSTKQYIRAGVAGFHIEDQVLQKRCGHLSGKEVVDADTYISRIRAAIAAREELNSDIVIIARTDALQPHGYDECITRLKRARAEGADAGLLEGFTTKAEARKAVKDLAGWPLMINMVENAVTPLITVPEAREMGFRIMNFSFCCLSATYTGIHSMLTTLKETGITGISTQSQQQTQEVEKTQQVDEVAMMRLCKAPSANEGKALTRKRKASNDGVFDDYIVWIKRRCTDIQEEKPEKQAAPAIGPKFLFNICGMQKTLAIDAHAGGAVKSV